MKLKFLITALVAFFVSIASIATAAPYVPECAPFARIQCNDKNLNPPAEEEAVEEVTDEKDERD